MTGNNTKNVKKKVEQNDPNGAKLKSIKTDLLCGGMHQISVFRPSVIIDAHMHIQSGNCAPVQIIWDRISLLGKAEPSRGAVEVIGTGIFTTLDLVMFKHATAFTNKVRNKKRVFSKICGHIAVPASRQVCDITQFEGIGRI